MHWSDEIPREHYLYLYDQGLIGIKQMAVKKYFEANPEVYEKYRQACLKDKGFCQDKAYSKAYLAKRKYEMAKFIEDERSRKNV